MSRDSETVSKNMRSIHSKDTSIELQLRCWSLCPMTRLTLAIRN